MQCSAHDFDCDWVGYPQDYQKHHEKCVKVTIKDFIEKKYGSFDLAGQQNIVEIDQYLNLDFTLIFPNLLDEVINQFGDGFDLSLCDGKIKIEAQNKNLKKVKDWLMHTLQSLNADRYPLDWKYIVK